MTNDKKMIIDADVHVTPVQDNELCTTFDRMIEYMDESGVDKVRCQPHPPYVKTNLKLALKHVYEGTKKYPDRILGYGWVDPSLGMDEAKDTIKRCFEEYGFYGVKFNGSQNQYFADDPDKVLPLVELVAKYGKTIAFHSACDAYERTHPYRVMHVAQRFPELPVLMVHMGGAAVNDLHVAAIEAAEACPNITLVGSDSNPASILHAIKRLGAHRVCFGSDAPFQIMRVEVAKYHALLDNYITPEEKELVMSGNISRFLGL